MTSITEQSEASCRTLFISGRFEFQSRQAFNAALERTIQAKPHKVVLNLSKVSYINGAGISLLLGASKKSEEAKTHLALEVSPGFVLDVLNLSDVAKQIPLSQIEAKSTPSASSKPSPPLESPSISTIVFESDEMEALFIPILRMLEQKKLDLPLLTDVASQVLSLSADPNATADRLTTVIQQDPVLMAKIFKTANSAGYGTSKKIESLQQAIAWLGLSMVESLTIALSLQANVFNDRGYEREVRGLWAHAIATAFYGKMVARLIRTSPDTVFLGGLLHTIGKLAVIHQFNELRGPSSTPVRWSVMETILEQSYVEVGRQLADDWNFPFTVKETIVHHQPHSYHLATHPSKGAAITCLARQLATFHLESITISKETLGELPIAAALNVPETVIDEIRKTKPEVQNQIDGLIL